MRDGNIGLDSDRIASWHPTDLVKAEASAGRLVHWLLYSETACLNAQSYPGVSLELDDLGMAALALKERQAKREYVDRAVRSLATLNRLAINPARGYEIGAATDVSGFGWIGDSQSLVPPSAVRLLINVYASPLFEGVTEEIWLGVFPPGALSNRKLVECVEGDRANAALACQLQTRSGK